MLPAVTEVVRDLARTVSADPAVLFKAARSVVADELARVKQGFESAPLDVLVKRARRQLEAEGVAAPAGDDGEASEPKSISIPAPPLRPREKKPGPAAGEGPFQSAGAADLDWEKDLNIQPDDAPFRSAILPLPPRARAPQEIPPAARPSAPVRPAAPAVPAPLPPPERVTAPEGLAVERSGSAPLPKPGVEDLPLFNSPTLELSSPVAPAPPPARRGPVPEPEMPSFAPPPPPAPRVESATPRVEPPAPRWEPRPEIPATAPEVQPRPEPEPRFETPPPVWEAPTRRLEPPVKSMSEMPPLASVIGETTEPVEAVEAAGPEMREFAFQAAGKSAPAKKSGGTGWIVALLLVLAVAAGLLWAVRTFLSGGVVRTVEVPPPAPRKRAVPAPAPPASAAPEPVQVAAEPPPKSAPVSKSAPKEAAPVPKGKAAPLLTPDWAGRPVVYVVHFSSHRDRPSAEKEAKRLAALLGKPGRAVEVDLGAKGIWYRVVIGEFATVEEARAYRADLEAKKTPDLGFVYEMRGR
jgi:hypothetical protein